MYKINPEDILDFKPKAFVKPVHTAQESIQQSLYNPSMSASVLSKVTTSTITSSITNVLNSIYNAKTSIEKNDLSDELEKIKSVFSTNQPLDSELLDYIRFNCNDINGDVKVEVYYALYNLQNELTAVKDVLNKIVYGDVTISDIDAAKIDSDKLSTLEYLEGNKENAVNYLSLNVDAKINSLLTAYTNSATEYSKGLISIIDTDVTGIDIDENLKDLTLKMFKSESEKGSACMDLHNNYVNTNIVPYMIIDTYKKRASAISGISSYNSIMNLSDYRLIGKYMNEYHANINVLNNSIVELSKSIITNALNKGDYADSIIDKNNLRSLYNFNFKTTK